MNKDYRKWNQKIYFVGMGVMVLAAVIGAVVLSQLRLNENYFFKNYLQYEIMEDQEAVSIALYYLTNPGDTNKIVQATPVEYPELQCVISLTGGQSHDFSYLGTDAEAVGIYEKRCLRLVLYQADKYLDEDGRMLIQNIRLQYKDGSEQEVNVGRIEITTWRSQESLNFSSGSSSNQGDSSVHYDIKEEITLRTFENRYYDILGDTLQIELKGNTWSYQLPYETSVDLKNNTLKKGESLTISSYINVQENNELRYAYIDVKPKLMFLDQTGKENYVSIHNITHVPYLKGTWEMYKLVKEDSVPERQ